MTESENIFNQMDVSQLECHFKWFNELNNTANRKWLRLLLNKQLHNDLINKIEGNEIENCDEPDNEADQHQHEDIIVSQRLAVISWRFTLIVRATFEKNYAEAFQMSKELLCLEEAKNPSQPQVHIDTFSFIVLANQLNILKEWYSLVECSVDDAEIIEIWNQVESLRNNSEESNEGKAFINAVKCNFSRDMQDAQLRVDFAQKATELDPQCASWHQTLYWALRNRRRSTDFRQHPSELEIDSCEKGFELHSSEHGSNISLGIAIQMTRFYSELLFTFKLGSPQHKEATANALKFSREAVRLSPGSRTMKMRLVSLLTSYHVSNEDKAAEAEAQELVKECEANVSDCTSEICHKIGKYYNNAKNSNFDSAKALEWFERSLEVHRANFPCFSDMLRNEDFRQKPNAEIIDKIDTILNISPKRAFQCQLMFIKGFFLWTSDAEATLHLWLMAVEEAGDLNVNFVSLAVHNKCYVESKRSNQALQLMRNVKFFMDRKKPANSDDLIFEELRRIFNSVIDSLEQSNRKR